jgi:hypothetical protein
MIWLKLNHYQINTFVQSKHARRYISVSDSSNRTNEQHDLLQYTSLVGIGGIVRYHCLNFFPELAFTLSITFVPSTPKSEYLCSEQLFREDDYKIL